MPKKLSNKERILRRAKEAVLAAEEKVAKKTAKRKRPTKKVSPPRRMKTVWKVFNDNIKEVACFPYPQRSQADAKAAQLTKKTGKQHFVNGIKVPMADDE